MPTFGRIPPDRSNKSGRSDILIQSDIKHYIGTVEGVGVGVFSGNCRWTGFANS